MDNLLDRKENIISGIMLINTDDDKECILKILNETDINILKYLTLITCHDKEKIPASISKSTSAWGTMTSHTRNDVLISAEIDIVSSKFRSEKFFFENTLKHELGHIAGATISPRKRDSEQFANNYAQNPDSYPPKMNSTIDTIKNILSEIFGFW